MSKPKSSRGQPRRPADRRNKSTASEQITPRPEQDRQLGRDLLLVWRDGEAPGRRRGLALTIETCPEQQCACRAVTLNGVVVADDAATIELERGRLQIQRWAHSAPVDDKLESVAVDLDLETGLLEPLLAGSPDLTAWLASSIDGHLLDRLHERWRIGKGWPGRNGPRKAIELRGWQTGELLGFDEVFDGERYDRFVIGDSSYWAYTFLCPMPGCDCASAEVQFARADADDADGPTDSPADVGFAEIDLRRAGDGLVELCPEPGQDLLLVDLWSRFAARHAVVEYLKHRQARMRIAWPAVESALRAIAPSTAVRA